MRQGVRTRNVGLTCLILCTAPDSKYSMLSETCGCRCGPQVRRSTPAREGARSSPLNPGNLSSSHLFQLYFTRSVFTMLYLLRISTGKDKDRSPEKKKSYTSICQRKHRKQNRMYVSCLIPGTVFGFCCTREQAEITIH
jgi:hypothetical protein